MAQNSELRPQSVSVVVTAQSHNPSILTGEFLASSGIVPREWRVEQTINLPPFSMLRYHNGVQWILDETRLVVSQESMSGSQAPYEIHECIVKYLQKVEQVPYRSLGLNCAVFVASSEPELALTERFLKEGPWLDDQLRLVGMVPRFSFDADGPVLNVSCNVSRVGQDAESQGIHVQCNVHHQGPFEAAELVEAVRQWQRHELQIGETLKILFAGF